MVINGMEVREFPEHLEIRLVGPMNEHLKDVIFRVWLPLFDPLVGFMDGAIVECRRRTSWPSPYVGGRIENECDDVDSSRPGREGSGG